jgi:hypothetical protein
LRFWHGLESHTCNVLHFRLSLSLSLYIYVYIYIYIFKLWSYGMMSYEVPSIFCISCYIFLFLNSQYWSNRSKFYSYGNVLGDQVLYLSIFFLFLRVRKSLLLKIINSMHFLSSTKNKIFLSKKCKIDFQTYFNMENTLNSWIGNFKFENER